MPWADRDITGLRSGRLVAIEPTAERRSRYVVWLCQCDCGNQKLVSAAALRRPLAKATKSCGCLQRETSHQLALAKPRLRHGEARHGKVTAEYRAWQNMHCRCSYPRHNRFQHYGGRGIKVCVRWESYEFFLADMGRRPTPEHSIDRIDVNGNYEPNNCRWATDSEQMFNRRKREISNA